MDLLKFFNGLINFIWDLQHWRWSLCLWAGVILGFLAAALIQHEPWCWVVGGAVLLACCIVGWIWDDRSR
jgi:hypothetical protein